VIQDKIACR